VLALFRQKAPGTIAILFIAGLLLKLPLFTAPALKTARTDGPLFRVLAERLQQAPHWQAGLLAFGLLFAGAVLINYLVNEYRMISRQTFLPALSFLLITSLVPGWSLLSAPLCAALVLQLAFAQLLRLYGGAKANGRIYNIGLFTGLAAFFYPPALGFVFLALLGQMILRPFRFNEMLLLLLGLITPAYFYGVWLFLTDQLQWRMLVPALDFDWFGARFSYALTGALVLLGALLLLGAYYVQVNLGRVLIQTRKSWGLTVLFLLLALSLPLMAHGNEFTGWVLLAAPLAAFHASAYFYPPRRWVPLALFFFLLMLILAIQYGGIDQAGPSL